uniref:7TM_GPCR_Srx domain-containing protein n=1 Tax=Ascaris lumbricoides TaxID=6252 RepID=A0A0M3I673_ASCLU
MLFERFQNCASNVLFICCETSFSIVTRPLTSRWLLFLLGTLMWQLQHALDGLILVVVEWRNRQKQTKNVNVVVAAWSTK